MQIKVIQVLYLQMMSQRILWIQRGIQRMNEKMKLGFSWSDLESETSASESDNEDHVGDHTGVAQFVCPAKLPISQTTMGTWSPSQIQYNKSQQLEQNHLQHSESTMHPKQKNTIKYIKQIAPPSSYFTM